MQSACPNNDDKRDFLENKIVEREKFTKKYCDVIIEKDISNDVSFFFADGYTTDTAPKSYSLPEKIEKIQARGGWNFLHVCSHLHPDANPTRSWCGRSGMVKCRT